MMTRVLWLAVLTCVVQCLPMSQDELEDFSNFLLKTSSLDLHVKSVDPDGSFDEDEVVSDNAWEESGKFEGDLILNDRQRRLIVENVEGLSRNGLTDSTKRWPNNEVIYFIQKEHFTSGQMQAIQDGIDDLARASCVKFRPYRKGDRDAVVIQGSRRGCFSQVGYQGGYQVLNLSGRHPVGRGCFRHGTVVHELLHSLGFYHMQSSPDRDDYIDVIWSNIVQPARHNFRKYNSFSVSDFGVGYDYDSVLHYSRRAFSANGQDTLVPKKSGAQIGQRVGLSDKDTQKLNKMYCDADNDPVQEDENTSQKHKNKKKKPKNQPFQGHGIGYHQGKTVVIKLPAAQIYKLPTVPSTPVFDFSKTPEIVQSEAEGYRFGKEVIYPYKPVVLLNTETAEGYENSFEFKPIPNNNTQIQRQATDDKIESSKDSESVFLSAQHYNDSNKVSPAYVPIDEYDKDLNDAFDRLTKIVKQHVYPRNKDVYKIDKDYSKFYTSIQSKKSDPIQDSLDGNFKYMTSSEPTLKLQQHIDRKYDKVALDENSEAKDKFIENPFLDKMDTSYRTALPTKKPYSSYEQTETPHYATLKYLKNRHDYSNLYSAENRDKNKQSDETPTTFEDSKQHIKINPYEKGFYTDDVKEFSQKYLKDASKIENYSKQEKPSKYLLAENTLNKQSDFTNKQAEDGIDSSYGTILPTKKPYSSFAQTETPGYATLEYLKDRHDISNIYTPKTSDDDKQKEPYTALGVELPPTENDWYDKDSYSDYIQQDHKRYQKGKTEDRMTNIRESPNNTRAKYKTENIDKLDFYTNYEKENRHLKEKHNKSNEEDDNGHYTNNGNTKNSHSSYDSSDDEENGEIAPKSFQLKHEPMKYNHDSFTDYEKDHIVDSEEASGDNNEENSEESSQKRKAYTLYGAPVPLTREWFQPIYSIPELSNEDENSRSREEDNR